MKPTWIPTENDERLRAYLYAMHRPELAIIVCHGFSGCSSGILYPLLSKSLSKTAFVCRFDFRGQGESDGKFYDTCITRELEDLDHVVKFLKKEYRAKKIVLLGHSFGATIALLYAARHPLDGLIRLSGDSDLKDSSYGDFSEEQLNDFITKGYVSVVNWSLSENEEVYDNLGKQLLTDMQTYSTLDAARLIRVPTLLIHGKNDEVIPPSCSEQIYALIRAPKELILLDGVDHIYNYDNGNSTVTQIAQKIRAWIAKNV